MSKCYAIMDPNGHRQWARPSPRVFILKELNAAECERLTCETRGISYRSTLWHGKDVNHSDSVIINKLPQHKTHDLHRNTSTTWIIK